MKHPQITEEHAREILTQVTTSRNMDIEHQIYVLKRAEMIKKSPTEKLNERYVYWFNNGGKERIDECQYESILMRDIKVMCNELSKQIEELKK